MAKRQDRVELSGSTRAPLPGGKDVGPADPNQQIEVSVLLRRGAKPPKFPSSSLTGPLKKRKYLTREEFAHRHGAKPEDINEIHAFAKEYGLRVVSEDRASRTVKLGGTIQSFNSAFGVDLRKYQNSS
jgi:kumamolisin